MFDEEHENHFRQQQYRAEMEAQQLNHEHEAFIEEWHMLHRSIEDITELITDLLNWQDEFTRHDQ